MFSGAIVIWWMTGVNTDFSREICKTSVITAENTMLLKADSPFQLQCFTRTVQIEQGDKEIKPKKRLYRFQVDSQKELEKGPHLLPNRHERIEDAMVILLAIMLQYRQLKIDN